MRLKQNTKLLIFLLSLITLTLGLMFYASNRSVAHDIVTKEHSVSDDYQVLCSKNIGAPGKRSYISNVYINYDKKENITGVMYETIEDLGEKFSLEELSKTEDKLDIFNSIIGITANSKTINSNLVTHIKYDYKLIILYQIQKDLKGILPKDSVLMTTKYLPISFKRFKDVELKNYTCELIKKDE